MIKELAETIIADKPTLAPLSVWRAYELLENVSGQPNNQFTALVALIRKAAGIDAVLTPYDKTVDKNFQEWVFKKQAGAVKFTEEQMQWLRMLKDHIAASVSVDLRWPRLHAVCRRGRQGQKALRQRVGEDYQRIERGIGGMTPALRQAQGPDPVTENKDGG